MEGGLDIFQILLESGFVVKFVLLLLLLASIFSWAIILKKRKEFKNVMESNEAFLKFFNESSSLIEINEKASVYSESTISLMFDSGFKELNKIKAKLNEVGKESQLNVYLHQHGMQAIERSLKQGANYANERLDGRLSSLASIGSISPFIGLFGTVWGIIGSFTGLASGGGSIEAVAPGIAEALVATAVGLAAAIPAVWAYNLFTTKSAICNTQMESFGQDFLNLIERSILISKE